MTGWGQYFLPNREEKLDVQAVFLSSTSWPKRDHLSPYISDRKTTGSKVERASLSCPMCVCGGGGGERVQGGGASSARGGLTPRRWEISASTAAKRGAVLRGKFPLLWGTMRSISGAHLSPSS